MVQVKTGYFDKSSTATAGVPFDETISGIGFEPKALWVWTVATNAVTDHIRSSLGFADRHGNQRAFAWSSQDNVSTTSARRGEYNNLILKGFADGAGTNAFEISLKNFNSDGWVHTYNTNNATSFRVYYYVVGGEDIVDTYVGTFNGLSETESVGSTTEVTWTNGFIPSMVFFATTAVGASQNTHAAGARISIGFASSDSKQGVVTTVGKSGLGTTADKKQHARRVSLNKTVSVLNLAGEPQTAILEASYRGGTTTANGFNMRWDTITTDLGGVNMPISFLAIKGAKWDVSPQEFPTVTGTQTVITGPTGMEFTPKGLMWFSTNNGNTIALTGTAEPRSASATNTRLMIGSATSTTVKQVTWEGQDQNNSAAVTARSSVLDAALQIRLPNATGANSAISRNVDLQSIGAAGYTLNHTAVDSVTVGTKFFSIAVGDTVTGVFVEKELIAKYRVAEFVEKPLIAKYSMGGLVMAGPFQHIYDIQGLVEKQLLAPFHIREFVEKELIAPYHITQGIRTSVEKQLLAKYHMQTEVEKELMALYSIQEDPLAYLRKADQGYGLRVYIMSARMDHVYHVFNSFDNEESTIAINRATVDLDSGSAPECTLEIEDSAHLIDTTQVGEGCVVVVQAAKNAVELNDGKHDLFMGYIRQAMGQRPDTNNLIYVYTAYGAKIRFNERLTSFNRTAKRINFESAEPDPDDPRMKAWRLFYDLVTAADHLPFGSPRERQFTTKGITDPRNRVDNFIAQVDEELVEWSTIADDLAERSTAEWDVSPTNDVFFRYPTLEPSGVIIKDRYDREEDDPDNTCYFIGEWSWTNSMDKEDGFTNRFAATVGSKSTRANVKELAAIADSFTPLAVDEPPSDSASGTELPEGYRLRVGPLINIRGDLIGPNNPVWAQIANYQRRFNYNIFYVVLKIGTGTDGPGPTPGSPDWVNPIGDMVEARCRLLGYVNTLTGQKTLAQMQAEVDRWYDLWGPYGIFLDQVSTDPSLISHYNSISNYIKNRGFKWIFANTPSSPPQPLIDGCPSINTFVVYEGAGLPDPNTVKPAWWGQYDDEHRAMLIRGITHSVASDDDVAQWTANALDTYQLATWIYITHDNLPQPYDTLSSRMEPMLFAMERNVITVLQSRGYLLPGIAAQQDVGMSFIAESSKIDDLSIIMSKVGNVSPVSTGELTNHLYGEMLNNRQVLISREDPTTGVVTSELVDMPEHTNPSTPVASFRIPLNDIEEGRPTVIFLGGIARTRAAIIPGRRYWIVFYGRGRDEANTVRWHHSEPEAQNEVDPNYRVGIRVPSQARNENDIYHVYTRASGHPGLSLSYFKNKTNLLEASDPDSIDRFHLVESKIEFPDISDNHMVLKTLHSILHYSARPKRVYDIGQITAPNKLLFPGMLVTIIDQMAGLGSGTAGGGSSEGTEAELLSVGYEWDASQDVGCRYLTINAVGHVDFAWALWHGRFKRGEINFETPTMPPIPPIVRSPSLHPPGAPIIFAHPAGGTYQTGVSVRFSSDRQSVIVYYTRDGTVPANARGGSTFMYIPGESPNIVLTSSTLLRYKGVDRFTNVMSAVYAQQYNIGAGQVPPGGGGGGGGTAPQPTGGKMMWVLFRQDVDRIITRDTYPPYLNNQLDAATLQIIKGTPVNSLYESTVLGTQTIRQDIEFQVMEDLENYIPIAKAKGWEVVSYNFEPNRATSKERDDIVATHRTAAALIRKHGLKVRFNPDMEVSKVYGSRIVRFCDFYNIQAHELQHELEGYRNYIKKTAASMRQNNTNVFLTTTLSAGHKAMGSLNVLGTMKHRWTYAKQYCDGVRIYFENTTQLQNEVNQFMHWFVHNGRSLQ